VVIRLPEHHVLGHDRVLVGEEALRRRLLEAVGLRVVEVDYDQLRSLPGKALRSKLAEECFGNAQQS
jgi:hypothetical protein